MFDTQTQNCSAAHLAWVHSRTVKGFSTIALTGTRKLKTILFLDATLFTNSNSSFKTFHSFKCPGPVVPKCGLTDMKMTQKSQVRCCLTHVDGHNPSRHPEQQNFNFR